MMNPFGSSRVGRSRGPDPVDAEFVDSSAAGPATAWQVRLTGAPDTLPYGTVVTIQSGEAAPAPGAKDQRRVSLAGMIATVAQGIRVFTGALLPQLSISVTPQSSGINAGDVLQRTLVATDFTTLPSGVREAVVPWSSLSGRTVINIPDPRLVPEPLREERGKDLPVLIGGVALLGYAAWRILWPGPRSNPGPCCAACARGAKCSGKSKRKSR